MSLTEQIIETVERARDLGLSDNDTDEMLYAIGCTRVIRIGDTVIVYYLDQGRERFVVFEFRSK